jgi:hypothetical protein
MKSEKWASAAACSALFVNVNAVAHFSLFTFHFSLITCSQ